ncbi:hypothetical protein NBH00_08025 [Paraconexibacter antarcticus]|uniref:TrbL/VirB6 plasmid conjugal transfer protein n=1 Tax=Paraconexibacter antarcticus TaxID=2949664 RepID=A0ABY5DX57_9ACTN|nr:hypothetical protein [Paraconexibacter antarcticus]UTI66139.1 hypothetical protein NBH00_08025 [Paraconexibacter antarcticus]
MRIGFSVTDPGKTFMGALQSLGAGLWMGLLYLMKAVLLLLEWAFSLDLTRQAMPSARRTLARLQGQVFGDPWLMLAITLTGLWGMWHGLVQRRAVETLGGVAATVALLVLGLVVISRPAETVGRAAAWSNDAGLSVLAAGTTGTVDQPRRALAGALRGVFQNTVRNPWCALEFGSVNYCDTRLDDPARPTTAELWLAYPAQSWQRDRLHGAMKPPKKGGGFDPIGAAKSVLGMTDNRKLPDSVTKLVRRDPEAAKMQEAGGTFPRIALLGTVTVGLLGAVALFAYIGLKLLLAAAMTLLLLLIAPAMLIAPALGQSGRKTFIAWGQRLIGAIIAKLVYAVLLTVVLAASEVFTGLDLGWFGTWLMLGAFWWGVFLKRHDLTGFVTAGAPSVRGEGTGHTLSQGYYAWMLGRNLRHGAGMALSPARGAARAAVASRRDDRAATAAARADIASEHLDAQGRRALGAEHAEAEQITERRGALQHELAATDRRLRGFDEGLAAARATKASAPTPTAEQRALLARRTELRDLLAAPEVEQAAQLVRHRRRTETLTGEPVSQRDLEVYRARRGRELDAAADPTDPRHVAAAGIDSADFAAAAPEVRTELTEQVTRHLERERAQHAAAGGEPHNCGGGMPWVDPDELRRRTAEHRARIRDERRRRRAGEGVYRPR